MAESVGLKLPSNAIICIVGDYCNLRCLYCFHRWKDQGRKQIMSSKLLEKFIREFLYLPLPIYIFSWHGGEPLLAGLDFFETAIELQNQYKEERQIIQNLVQTNGTLIDDEWALFFKNHNFGIGVSLDGNRETHDHFRVDKNGKGTFNKTMEGIKILRKHGIEPGILQTLTRNNISRAEESFQFFIDDLGIKNLGVNPYFDIVGLNKLMSDQKVTNKEFTTFLKTYIELWLERDDPNLRIREIDNFIGAVLRKPTHYCRLNGLCWTTFCINYNGEIYPCDPFLDQREFFCGDLTKQSLLEIFTGSLWQETIGKIDNLPPECRACKWQSVCHNGCSYLRVGGIEGKYYYCQAQKEIFAYLEKVTREYLAET